MSVDIDAAVARLIASFSVSSFSDDALMSDDFLVALSVLVTRAPCDRVAAQRQLCLALGPLGADHVLAAFDDYLSGSRRQRSSYLELPDEFEDF